MNVGSLHCADNIWVVFLPVNRNFPDAQTYAIGARCLNFMKTKRSAVSINYADSYFAVVAAIFMVGRWFKEHVRHTFACQMLILSALLKKLLSHDADGEKRTDQCGPSTKSAYPGHRAVSSPVAQRANAQRIAEYKEKAGCSDDSRPKPTHYAARNLKVHDRPSIPPQETRREGHTTMGGFNYCYLGNFPTVQVLLPLLPHARQRRAGLS